MRVDSLARARASGRLLSQYLLTCPGCSRPSAAHVEWLDASESSGRVVRFVCPEGCPVTGAEVLALAVRRASGMTA
jgi:hypothetical protein